MTKLEQWLKKSLVKAESIRDSMQSIPADQRTVIQNNRMISNGGKATILKNALDFIKTHPERGLTVRRTVV